MVTFLDLLGIECGIAITYGITITYAAPVPRSRQQFARISTFAVCILAALPVIWWAHTTTEMTMIVRYVIVGITCAVLGVGGLAGINQLHHDDAKSPPSSSHSQMVLPKTSGGRGGNATVIGSGTAIGGPGGHGGIYARGGNGGDAKVVGAGLAAGGEGGSGDSDNLWRPPARSGYEVAQERLGLPIDPKLRKYGRGGMSPGYEPKYRAVDEIRIAYFKRHKLPYVDAVENVNAIPLEYVNQELAKLNVPWRARIVRGSDYEFFIP